MFKSDARGDGKRYFLHGLTILLKISLEWIYLKNGNIALILSNYPAYNDMCL